MDSGSDVKYYEWPSTVNFANFVTVKLYLKGDKRSNFDIWKEQMLCLLESQGVLGFVDGGILPPSPESNADQKSQWRRTDRLVKGWILGSMGKLDAVAAVWKKPTARDVWLELENIFKEEEEEESEDYSRYLTLYKAVQRDEWEFARNFFPDINELITTVISSDAETALHVAVLTGKANTVVTELVNLAQPDALAARDSDGGTALHNAAFVGNRVAAEALINRNSDLLYSVNNVERLPVLEAAVNSHRETLVYMISRCDPNVVNNNPFRDQHGIALLNEIIAAGFPDIALDLCEKYPSLSILVDKEDGSEVSALSIIAECEILFPRTECFSWWESFLYHCIPVKESNLGAAAAHTTSVAGDVENLYYHCAKLYSTSFQIISQVVQKVKFWIWNHVMDRLVPQVKELREKKTTHEQTLQLADHLCGKIVSLPEPEATSIFSTSILNAARHGYSEIVEMIIHYYPMVAFDKDGTSEMNTFFIAADNRFENVINLLHNMSDRKKVYFSDWTDNESNTLMHICGKLAPPERLNLVPGAALQMQRELQWFKKMESFVSPSRRRCLNKYGQTPQMIFTKEHEKLKADGERWMKDTANACTIAAALIATVVFAAAFTIPGGLKSDTGFPLFSTKPAFVIFAVSDAVSLFTSITSLLMFLSILTSRYAEQDFMYVLPKRLTLGLLSLFVSITFMLVAFSAALYLLLHGYTTWFVVLVTMFASLPVTSFVLLQFPLLVDVISSTYGRGIFAKKPGRPLY